MGDYILIVDDDDGARRLSVRILARMGLEMREAHNGEEAIIQVENDPPALILLDMMMPETNGPTVIRYLQDHPELQYIPVVVITALEEDDPQIVDHMDGIHYVLQKGSYDADTLIDVVAACLEG